MVVANWRLWNILWWFQMGFSVHAGKRWHGCSTTSQQRLGKHAVPSPHICLPKPLWPVDLVFFMLRLCCCWQIACVRKRQIQLECWTNLNPLTCQQFGSQLHLVVSKNGWAPGTPTWMHYMSVIPWSKHNDIVDNCQCGSTLFLDLSHHKGNPIKSSTSNRTASHREAP